METKLRTAVFLTLSSKSQHLELEAWPSIWEYTANQPRTLILIFSIVIKCMLHKCVPFSYFWMHNSVALGISPLSAGTTHLPPALCLLHSPSLWPSPLCFICSLYVVDCLRYLTYVELHGIFPFWGYHDVFKNNFYYSMRYNSLLRLYNAPQVCILHTTSCFCIPSLENTGWFLSFGSGDECCHGHRSMTLNFLHVCLLDLHGHFWSKRLRNKKLWYGLYTVI